MTKHGKSEPDELLQVLGELLLEVHEADDLNHILAGILREAIRLVGAERGDLVMANASGDLKVGVTHGLTSDPLPKGASVPKESFVWHVYTRNEKTALIEGDVRSLHTEKHYHPIHNKTRSEAAVRLQFKHRSMGVLNVESERRNAFHPQHKKTLERLAGYAAIAVKLFEEERGFRKLVAKVLTERDDSNHDKLETILSEILEGVEEMHGLNRGLIYVADKDHSKLNVCGWRVKKRPKNGFSHSLDKEASFAGWIYSGTADLCEDATDRRVSARGRKQFGITNSLVGLPLTFAGERVGVLVCWSDRPPFPVYDDIQDLAPIATLCAWKVGVWQADETRRRANKMQTEQMEAFEALVKNLHVCIFRKDADSKFKSANPEFMEHLGLQSTDTIDGKDDFDFYKVACADAYQKADRKVIANGAVVKIDEWNQLKNSDDKRKVEGFKVRTVDQNGKQGVRGMFWDVTKREQLVAQKNSLIDLGKKMLDSALTDRIAEAYDEMRTFLFKAEKQVGSKPHKTAETRRRREARVATPNPRKTSKAAAMPNANLHPHPRSEQCVRVLLIMQKNYIDVGLRRQEIAQKVVGDFPDNKGAAVGRLLSQLEEDGFVEHQGNTSRATWTLTHKGRSWKRLPGGEASGVHDRLCTPHLAAWNALTRFWPTAEPRGRLS